MSAAHQDTALGGCLCPPRSRQRCHGAAGQGVTENKLLCAPVPTQPICPGFTHHAPPRTRQPHCMPGKRPREAQEPWKEASWKMSLGSGSISRQGGHGKHPCLHQAEQCPAEQCPRMPNQAEPNCAVLCHAKLGGEQLCCAELCQPRLC